MARPTKLTPEILAKAKTYLPWVKAHPFPDGTDRPPKLVSLSLFLGVDRNTITNWRKENPDFNDICAEITSAYEEVLVDNGLIGKYQPRVTTFLLSADHDKREKSDVTSEGKALPTPILNVVMKDDAQ